MCRPLQDKVLHNIMPIFTFMGANILRLDDAYSFRVIEKTMATVVPALVQVSSCCWRRRLPPRNHSHVSRRPPSCRPTGSPTDPPPLPWLPW